MNAFGIVDRLTRWAGDGLAALGAFAIALMMVHVFADVIARYFFNHPIEGTGETVTIYYMVMCVVLPLAYIVRGEGHIVVELFTQRMAPRRLALLQAVVGVVTFVYVALFTWKTGEEAIVKTAIEEVREAGDAMIIAWPTRWILPIGFGVMAVAVALRIVRDARTYLDK
jgi:TRAP-type C4-dicarboxylate transport system permease small subunit